MLALPDIIAHLDSLATGARSVEGVFPSLSEADTFGKRVRSLRNALEEAATAEPTCAFLATTLFPDLGGEPLLSSFAGFAQQLSDVAEKSGHPFTLIIPPGRNRNAEIVCHFEGISSSKHSKIAETTQRAIAGHHRIRPIEPWIAALRGSDLEQLASTFSEQDDRGRVRVKFFVSYTRKDATQANRLLEKLQNDLSNSKRFAFEFWQDTRIPVGAEWHPAILAALHSCDFGLALVSPAFFATEYITQHELPSLVDGEKPVIPVEIERLDYDRHDLRGLNERQIFKLEENGRVRSFSECHGNVASRFILAFASKIEERVELALRERAQARLLRAFGEPAEFERLSVNYPRLRELLQDAIETADPLADERPIPATSDDEASRQEKLRRVVLRQIPEEKVALTIRTTCAAMGLQDIERLVERSGQAEVADPYDRFRTHQRRAVDFLRDWMSDPQQPPFAAVLGETGSGKTTMLQMLAHDLASDPSGPPVIFLDLRDYQKSEDATLEGLLDEHLRRHGDGSGLKHTDVLHAVRREGALIIFDGLDEKIIPMSDGARQNFVRELWRVFPTDLLGSGASSFSTNDLVHPLPLVRKLATSPDPLSQFLWSRFSDRAKQILSSRTSTLPSKQAALRDELNSILKGDALYSEARFVGIQLSGRALKLKVQELQDEDLYRFNRLLLEEAYPLELKGKVGRLIISCRSHYFPTVQAQSSGYTDQDRGIAKIGDYVACVMLPWQQEDIDEYLGRALGPGRVKKALEVIASVHNLRDLARRPYLLNLITPELESLEKDRAAGRAVNAAALYRKFTARWLYRDDGKHVFEHEHKILLMEQIAAALWRDNAREWPWSRVSQWLDAFFRDRSDIADAYAREGRTRQVLKQDFRSATFFLRPDASGDAFRFAHTSLQEYFLACYLANCLTASQSAVGWDLPTPSLETFDFIGQLLDIMSRSDRDRALEGLKTLLESQETVPRAKMVAFTFLCRAAKSNYPIPQNVAARLGGVDCAGWEIGGWANRPLRMVGVDFSGARLVGTKFGCVELTDSRWQRANLSNAQFSGTENQSMLSTGADFSEAQLSGATFRHVELANARWQGADLTGVQFSGMASRPLILTETDFCGANLIQANFRYVALTNSRWWGADLRSAEFLGCAMHGTRFDCTAPVRTRLGGVRLRNCQLAQSRIEGAVLEGLRVDRPIWDKATEEHWRETVDAYLPAWQPNDGGVWKAPLATGSTSPFDPADSFSLEPLANWSLGHQGNVSSVVFSPDSRRALTCSDDHTLRLWDIDSGACLRVFEGYNRLVVSAAFSPDGRQILSVAFDDSSLVYDAESGICLRVFQEHFRPLARLAFSPDGFRFLGGSGDRALRVWDFASGECLGVCTGHSKEVVAAAFSFDGKRIVSGSLDDTVRVWDAENSACLHVLEGHSSQIMSVAFTPDGRRIVSGSFDNTVRVWDAKSGACLHVLKGHSGEVTSVALTFDGRRIVSGSYDHTLRIWDTASGVCLRELTGHRREVTCLDVSPDGQRIISGSDDRAVRVWDVETGACLRIYEGFRNGVLRGAFSSDGKRIFAHLFDDTVRGWMAATGAPFEMTTKEQRRWLEKNKKSRSNELLISSLGTLRYRRPDDTTLEIAALPNGGYAVLEESRGLRTRRLIHGSAECWRYVNYATDTRPDGTPGRVLYSADIFGAVADGFAGT